MLRDRGRPAALALVGALAASSLAVSVSVSVAVAPRAHAGEEVGEVEEIAADCAVVADEDPGRIRNPDASPPLEQLRVDEVQQRYGLTGAGVGVAVVDSGIAEGTGFVEVAGSQEFGDVAGPIDVEHGTVVAGLIAGSSRGEGAGMGMGVAPGADLYSLRIVGAEDPEEDESALGLDDDDFERADVVAALRWVADNARQRGIRVVNLSLIMQETRGLAEAVANVQSQDVVVVAATGNQDPEAEIPDPSEMETLGDPVQTLPAALPDVVGVGAAVPLDADGGAPRFVLPNVDVDVVAPTVGGASVVPGGSTCLNEVPATSWAAAYVSGVLALLAERHPDENALQLVARLEETASGTTDQRSTLTGFGVVQPVEAITRDLSPSPQTGALEFADPADEDSGPAAAPPIRADELADARDDFRWWGLLAGAVLVAAVILRPLLRRARRS